MHKVCILVLKNVPKLCLSCAQTVPNLCTSCAKILSHSENRVQPIELHSERKGRTAIMSVLRFTKSRNTVWRPFYPLIRNNMTQNTVRDSSESPDKQETGILNQPRSQGFLLPASSLSLSRSRRRVGENPGNEVDFKQVSVFKISAQPNYMLI